MRARTAGLRTPALETLFAFSALSLRFCFSTGISLLNSRIYICTKRDVFCVILCYLFSDYAIHFFFRSHTVASTWCLLNFFYTRLIMRLVLSVFRYFLFIVIISLTIFIMINGIEKRYICRRAVVTATSGSNRLLYTHTA